MCRPTDNQAQSVQAMPYCVLKQASISIYQGEVQYKQKQFKNHFRFQSWKKNNFMNRII